MYFPSTEIEQGTEKLPESDLEGFSRAKAEHATPINDGTGAFRAA